MPRQGDENHRTPAFPSPMPRVLRELMCSLPKSTALSDLDLLRDPTSIAFLKYDLNTITVFHFRLFESQVIMANPFSFHCTISSHIPPPGIAIVEQARPG